jgi:hypothetical protein
MTTPPTEKEHQVSKLLRWGLAILGTNCIICFFSLSGTGGHGQVTFNIGWPDHWFVWENEGFAFILNRWSVAIGIVGVVCWSTFFRLRRAIRRKADEQ